MDININHCIIGTMIDILNLIHSYALLTCILNYILVNSKE